MPDLNNMTSPGARVSEVEVFNPTNGWAGAPARIYVDVNRMGGGLYQTGYDPNTGRTWVRTKRYDQAAWSTWKAADGGNIADPPVPVYAHALDNKTVEIDFSLLLDPASIPATTAFNLKVATVSQTLATVALNGPNCLLTTSSALPAGAITVSYTPPGSNMLKSVDGIDVLAFTDFAAALS